MKPSLAVVGALLSILFCTTAARGDGGTVRASETHGTMQVTIFTSPTPLRAGQVDVSVLVQDMPNGATATDAEIEVLVHPVDAPGRTMRQFATVDRAVNKLLRAAEFDVVEPGPTEFTIVVRRQQQPELRVRFEADVAPPLPRWARFWPWFTWPLVVAALFILRRRF
jgi:hypothetical protein